MSGFLFDPGFLCFILGLLGSFPGFFDEGELLFKRGNGCFSCWLVYLWGVSYEEIKGGFLCCCRWLRVFGVLCKGEPCMPVVLLCSAEYSEILFQGLIGSFACSIGLRVILMQYGKPSLMCPSKLNNA